MDREDRIKNLINSGYDATLLSLKRSADGDQINAIHWRAISQCCFQYAQYIQNDPRR